MGDLSYWNGRFKAMTRNLTAHETREEILNMHIGVSGISPHVSVELMYMNLLY